MIWPPLSLEVPSLLLAVVVGRLAMATVVLVMILVEVIKMDVAEAIFIDSALIVIVIIILLGSSWSHVCLSGYCF